MACPIISQHRQEMRELARAHLGITRVCLESLLALSTAFNRQLSRQLDGVLAAIEATSS
jgi:hypothetical protein